MIAAPPPRPWLVHARAAGWVVAFLVGSGALVAALVYAGAHLVPGFAGRLATNDAPGLLLQGGLEVVAFGAMTLLVGGLALHLTAADLRWRVPAPARGFGAGFAAAASLAIAAMLVAVAGGARWRPDAGGLADWVGAAAGTAVLLAPAALAEELLLRGVPLQLLARTLGRPTAIVLCSLVFGLLHARNPGVTSLALGNIALAGVFLSLVCFTPGGMWAAWGAHLGWNATLAALDAPVSGLPLRIPAIDFDPGSRDWLTGGAFGPEGGLTATVVLLAACLLLGRRAGKDLA